LIKFQYPLQNGLKTLKIKISDDQVQLMTIHAKELMMWNKKINLTAIKQPLQIAEKHFIDSLAAASFIKNKNSIIDLGSGGGFPGIPLKIMNPLLNVVLIDSSRKKISFLKHIIRLLGLQGINAIHSRAQDLHDKDLYIAGFDAVISRAFTDLSNFVKLASPFLNKKGTIYAMKGKQAKKEITPELVENFNVATDHYILPFEKSDRYIITLSQKNENSTVM
jgi:16S rRNA (guanine527-N7)-methyltransferase